MIFSSSQFLKRCSLWLINCHCCNHSLLVSYNSSYVVPDCLQEIQPISNESSSKRRWFAKPLSQTDIDNCCKPCVPKNTQCNTSWGVCVFDEWVTARNSRASSASRCPENFPSLHNALESVAHQFLRATRGEGRVPPGMNS